MGHNVYTPTIWYIGSKYMQLPWLIPCLPTNARLYCEPFGGSAVVLANRPRAEVEVYNDMNPEPCNLFRVLPRHWEHLRDKIAIQPYHHGDFRRCQDLEHIEDPVERAFRYWVRTRQSKFGKGSGGRATWGTNTKAQPRGPGGPGKYVMGWLSSQLRLEWLAERMDGVLIECADAIDVMRKYDGPDALFYVDPPYVNSGTHSGLSLYKEGMSDKGHADLIGCLKSLRGRWALAGYANPLYMELLEGIPCHVRPAHVSPLTNDNSDRSGSSILRQELMWTNFEIGASEFFGGEGV